MPEYWDPEIETMPVENLNKLQEEKLKRLVHYVYENSPFYRKKFDEHGVKPEDIQTLEDIRKLPFTVKQDLRDTYPTGMFCVPNSKLTRFHASSGTTGKPIVVGIPRMTLMSGQNLLQEDLLLLDWGKMISFR